MSLLLIQEQFSEVLDAMFEVLVQPQEHVIDQGDDGDNFYVIERCVFFIKMLSKNLIESIEWILTMPNFASPFYQVTLLLNALLCLCNAFVCVCRGVYDIVVQKDGVGCCVGQYDNKGSFGELALMYNTPRAATIIAKVEGALWGLVSV